MAAGASPFNDAMAAAKESNLLNNISAHKARTCCGAFEWIDDVVPGEKKRAWVENTNRIDVMSPYRPEERRRCGFFTASVITAAEKIGVPLI